MECRRLRLRLLRVARLFAFLWSFPGLLARLRQHVERPLDIGDHAGGDAGIARRGIQLLMPEQDLDDTNIDVLLEQVGCKAVPLMPSSA